MPQPPRAFSPVRRYALAIWFCGIAVIGAMEFHRTAFAAGHFAPTFIAWLWLAGTLVTAVIGILLALRERRASRSDR
ncbi:hypothetical protein [Luteimonas panaciterrae]|uniref:hypothetical protein n=1 Tax=Luteimonas panaciterrae TaxID=363885 RepID=UPI001CFB7490|nr:hypothetical protein [Luteimonas panaciterrae]